MPTIDEPILKGIGFKQLVVSESEDPTQESRSKLAIFAVSDDDCLYFIQGTRDYSSPKLKYKFEASSFPIRKGITHLASRFNALHGTNELLYASSEHNTLFFLRRTPEGTSWIEDKITRRATQYIKYDAFVTTIVLTDGHGSALPTSHTVSITADSLHAVANGKSYNLSNQPVNIAPDKTGCVLIAIPSASKLGCSPIQVSITGAQDTRYTFSVDPSQRVSRLLSNYNSPDKLRNAKSSSREPFMKGMSSEQLTNAASLLAQYKKAKENMESPTVNSISTQQDEMVSLMSTRQDETINFMSVHQDSEINWVDKAIEGVQTYLSDAIESIKFIAKATVNFIIQTFNSSIRFILKISGKVLVWTCKTLWSLLEVVGSVLESWIGFDYLTKLLNALKLAVNTKEISKTQGFLSEVITQGLQLTSKAIVATTEGLMDVIHDGGEFIQGGYIIDPTRVHAGRRSSPPPPWVAKNFNNPFTRLLFKINPLSWILEVLRERIPGVKLPNLGPLVDKLSAVFADTLDDAGDILQTLWDTILGQILVVSADPTLIVEAILNALGGVFWTVWDTAALVIQKTFGSLAGLIDELAPLLKEEWNVPGLTDTWEDLTGKKFSLLGFLTFVPAVVINLACAILERGLPEFGPVDMSSIKIQPFYQRSAMFASTSEEAPLALMTNTEPVSDEKKDTPEGDTEKWTMAHWYQLILEDLGKTSNASWSMYDSIFESMTGPEGGELDASGAAEMGSIW